jgi:peptidoglycan hydrolase FlgJ
MQITGIGSLTASPVKPPEPGRVHEAAGQFEALLIGQMLKTARETGDSSWLGTGDDEAGQTGMEMAEQQFAQAISKAGGLGLAAMVTRGLSRASTPVSSDLPPSGVHTPAESGE